MIECPSCKGSGLGNNTSDDYWKSCYECDGVGEIDE